MTFFFDSAHKSSDVATEDCLMHFLSELDCFDFAYHFFLVLYSLLELLCWSFLLACCMCLLNCFFHLCGPPAAGVLLLSLAQQHCHLQKLLKKIHEIVCVIFNLHGHAECFRLAQMLCICCNALFVHSFPAVLLL